MLQSSRFKGSNLSERGASLRKFPEPLEDEEKNLRESCVLRANLHLILPLPRLHFRRSETTLKSLESESLGAAIYPVSPFDSPQLMVFFGPKKGSTKGCVGRVFFLKF
jgi:hypothetical protein